ncbi:MAG: SWIM zinc finger domain-containing protein [Saprospiraceae bacterium]
MQFTPAQVLQLAPDDASAKAGRQLANATKWLTKCAHEKALWGKCKGSGSALYVTMVDLTNLAFKCSCPSRKFPCKHGLGLLLFYVNNADLLTKENNLAPHVAEWINRRAGKAEAKTQDKPTDEAAQRKRAEARTRKVESGIEELRIWLKDVVRTGIMQVPQNPYQFNKNIIARLIDAQATGLAARVRAINKINFYQEGWQKSLLKRLANIYLLAEAYCNINNFNDGLKQEIQMLIGWNSHKEDILKLLPVHDRWVILSKTIEEEDNLRTERIWLYGIKTGQFALLLHFYAFNQQPQHIYIEGHTLEAELVFYPAALPLRALVKQQIALKPVFTGVSGTTRLLTVHQQITAALLKNPFIEKIPLLLSEVKLGFQDKNWFVTDAENRSLALTNTEDESWKMLAISKGKAFSCFALHDQEKLDIHALWLDQKFYFLK